MKNNLNTVFVGFFFMLYMIFSALLFIPLLILSIPGLEKPLERFTHWITSTWVHFVFGLNRSRMHVTGLENLPDHKQIIYIGNHQGYADIPLSYGDHAYYNRLYRKKGAWQDPRNRTLDEGNTLHSFSTAAISARQCVELKPV